MNDSWNDMRRVKEEEFFDKQNKAALERLKHRKEAKSRLCPIDGKTLEQHTVMGIVIDKCPDCQGVWLDGGELEEIIKSSAGTDQESWTARFFSGLFPGR